MTDKYSFVGEIDHRRSDRYTIKFGGRDKNCIMITVYRGLPSPEREQAHIDGLHYSKDCILTGNMEKSEGTRHMIIAALHFVCKKFPRITSFTLKDESRIKCKYNIEVPLNTYYIAKHGETWYSKYFDAKPMFPGYQQVIENIKRHVESKHEKNFDVFWTQYILPFINRMRMVKKKVLYKTFEEFWNDTETYKDFFNQLAEIDCIIFQYWLNNYFVDKGWTSDALWIIYKPSIEMLEYKIKKQQSGGFSFPDFKKKQTKMNFGKYEPTLGW